jgi:hypothetical protein
MSGRPQKTGRVLERGNISAASIAAALGLGGAEPEVRAPKLTPAQARAKAEGKTPPPPPPDFETTVIQGGRDVWEFLGKPPLEAPEGTPQGQALPTEPPPKPQPQRANWDALEDGPPKLDAAEAELAAKPDPKGAMTGMVEGVRAHAARVRANFEDARGTPREAAALDDVKKATALVARASGMLK